MEEFKDSQQNDPRQFLNPPVTYQKEITANLKQMARLNCMMPRGFRFELKSGITDLNSEIIPERRHRINYQQLAEGPPSEDEQQHSASEISLKNNLKRHSMRKKKPAPFKELGFVTQTNKKRKKHEGPVDKLKIEANILKMLKKHPSGHHFLLPVQIKGYNNIIKEPMDFETVEKKIQNAEYTSFTQFKNDIRKIWNNAHQFNEPGSQIYKETTIIKDYFEELLQKIYSNHEYFESSKIDLAESGVPMLQHPTPNPGNQTTIQKNEEAPMTPEQKTELKCNLAKLKSEKLPGVINLLRESVPKQINNEIFEFDIDKLPTYKCWELDTYVRQNLVLLQKPASKKFTPIKKESKKISESKGEENDGPLMEPMIIPPVPQIYPSMPNMLNQEEYRQLNNERFLIGESEGIHLGDEESVRRPENDSRRIWDGSDIGHADPSLHEREYSQSSSLSFINGKYKLC